MGYLSDSLKKYYRKNGRRVIFATDISLSNLSLHMWELLGYQEIDSSVVSRVLTGERLFTPNQLSIFCQILGLNSQEQSNLLQALAKDYLQRDHFSLDISISHTEIISMLQERTRLAQQLFYQGNSFAVIAQYDYIQTLFEKLNPKTLTENERKILYENYGYFLLLKNRSLAGTADATTILQQLPATAQFLQKISIDHHLPNLTGYAHVLLADTWYFNGLSKTKTEMLIKAISHANAAFTLFPNTHPEKLASLRLMAAAACYIPDEETIVQTEKLTLQLLPYQREENIMNAIHVGKTVTKGRTLRSSRNPFLVEEKIAQHFHHTHNVDSLYFELSNIKTRLETFSLLHLNDTSLLMPLITRGLSLTQQESFPRHKAFFTKQLQQYL